MSQTHSKSLRCYNADVWDLAALGHAEAKRLLSQRATILADVILGLALILNPNLILLGGEVGSHPALLREVSALLEGSEFAILRVASTPAVLLGAVSVAVEPAIRRMLQVPR